MDLDRNIKEWVSVDNKIKEINKHVKELREKRGMIEEDIIDFVKSNNLEKATININDGKLKFSETNQSSPLTFKYVESCLSACISDPQQVKLIMNYIKKSRSTKTSLDIKRLYNK